MPKFFLPGAIAAALLFSGGGFSALAQQTTAVAVANENCSGVVVDSQGEPIIGASVSVKGTNIGGTTNVDGRFSFPNVKPGTTLLVRYIGCSDVSVVWNGEPLSITLTENANALDEVVVVGYGVQKKANVTGAVSSIKADALEDRSVASVSAAMAGQMPGVVVVQSSGAPGGQTGSITIRGNNTVNAASPLVIVDGVPGSMNNIDPQDVESISVLKDAASAAIYGVQAANGVILITTKKGTPNTKATVNYTGTVSFVSPTARLKKVNAFWHTTLKREAALNGNPNADVSSFDETLAKYASGELDPEGTDWWAETFKKHGTETAHTIQINGGSASTTYMASLGYLYQGGLTDENNYNRYNGRVNMDSKIQTWLALGLNASFSRGISKDDYTGFASLVQHSNRLNATHTVYDENGNFKSNEGMQNPVAERGQTGDYRVVNDQLFTNLYLNITPIKGLSIRPLFSWRHDYKDYYRFRKVLNYDGNYNNGENGVRRADHNYYNWEWLTYQAVANYNTSIGLNNIGVLAGYEASKYTYRYTTASRTGGGDNALDEVFGSLDKDKWTNDDGGHRLTRRSWFGRVQYDFDSRYLFEANFRADASSRFQKNYRWGYFPAFSAAWRLSEENFMEGTRGWLNNLKIRVGWGKTGNEEIDEYYPGVATYTYYPLLIGQSQYTSLYESKLVNSDLKWATVTNTEFGIEGSMFNNRFTFEAALYKKKTNDMLLSLPIMQVIGMSSQPSNAGSVENKGFELTLSHNNHIGEWSYDVTLNVGYNHNEILDLHGTDGGVSGNQWYKVGEAIGSYYGLVCDGIFRDEAEVAAGPLRTGAEKPGNLRFKDINGDGKITNDDRTTIGHTMPSWMGGLSAGATWRNFDLSMLWQGAFDVDRYMNGEASQAFYNNGTALEWHLDRWTPENPNGTYPRLYSNSSSSPDVAAFNSFWVEDASYIRLKNLTFGYTIPVNITKKAGFSKVRVFFNGENLLTFSKLYDKNIDPEAPQGRGDFYSNVKKYSIGLKLTF